MKFIRLSRKSWWKRGTWENNCCTARPLFGKINTRWYVKEVPRGHRFLRLFYVWNGWSQILNLVSHSALFIRSLSRIFRLIFAWLCNQCKIRSSHHIILKTSWFPIKQIKKFFQSRINMIKRNYMTPQYVFIMCMYAKSCFQKTNLNEGITRRLRKLNHSYLALWSTTFSQKHYCHTLLFYQIEP